jgi:hypothetical protein
MTPLPFSVTDDELISFLDHWVFLLEQEDYEAAFEFTDHEDTGWDFDSIRDVIKSYGDADPNQRVTVQGTPNAQRKEIDRWPDTTPDGAFGHVWYDLNVDGKTSDLTATFFLKRKADGVTVSLEEIGIR